MTHQHTYDANGKQNCCTLEEKINKKTEHHSNDDGHDHDHSGKEKSTFQLFLPSILIQCSTVILVHSFMPVVAVRT